MTSIFFLVNAIETALLAIYFYQSGSTPSEQIWLGLSIQRLTLVFGLGLLATAFCAAAAAVWRKDSRFSKNIRSVMGNESKCWQVLLLSLFSLAVMLVLSLLKPSSLGDLKNIYLQFKPVLSLAFLLSAQNTLVMLVWISFRFLSIKLIKDVEISRIWFIFAIVAAVKCLWVIPGAYGPVNGDEMEYFSLAYYLSQGNIFQAVDAIHYPPLYPAFLSMTIPFGLYTFDLIKILNVLLSSSIVFPIYLIARRFLDERESLLVVLAACLLPFHLVFPRRIQSENLYFPLFYWAIYLILAEPADPRSRTVWNGLSGLCLGLLYLTRYITLATLPAFLLGWSLKTFRREKGTSAWQRQFMILAASGLLIYTPWVVSGTAHGHTVKDMLGLFITASVENPQQLSFSNLMLWVLIYAAYLVLMAAPVLPFLLLLVRDFFSGKLDPQRSRWFILAAALTAVYSAAVVRHSWRANYNADLPVKIMGRYLIFLAPLFLISAALAFRTPSKEKPQPAWRTVLSMLVIPSGLISAAYCLIIQKSLLPISSNALNRLGAVDGYLVSLLDWRFFVILLPLYLGSLITYRRNDTRMLLRVVSLGLAIFYLAALPAYREELQNQQQYTLIGKQTAEEIAQLDHNLAETDIRFLLPNSLLSVEKQQIYMSVQVRGYPLLTPASYNSAKPISSLSANTIVLWKSGTPWVSERSADQVIDLVGNGYTLNIFY